MGAYVRYITTVPEHNPVSSATFLIHIVHENDWLAGWMQLSLVNFAAPSLLYINNKLHIKAKHNIVEWVSVYKQQEHYYTKHIHLRRTVDVMENGKATTECADIFLCNWLFCLKSCLHNNNSVAVDTWSIFYHFFFVYYCTVS